MAKKRHRREKAADRAERKRHAEAGIGAGELEIDTYERDVGSTDEPGGYDEALRELDGVELENEGVTVTLDDLKRAEREGHLSDRKTVAEPEDPAGGYHWLKSPTGEPVLVNAQEKFVGFYKDFDPPERKAKRRAAEREEEERLRCIEVQKSWWAKEPPYWKPHHDLEIARG